MAIQIAIWTAIKIAESYLESHLDSYLDCHLDSYLQVPAEDIRHIRRGCRAEFQNMSSDSTRDMSAVDTEDVKEKPCLVLTQRARLLWKQSYVVITLG